MRIRSTSNVLQHRFKNQTVLLRGHIVLNGSEGVITNTNCRFRRQRLSHSHLMPIT